MLFSLDSSSHIIHLIIQLIVIYCRSFSFSYSSANLCGQFGATRGQQNQHRRSCLTSTVVIANWDCISTHQQITKNLTNAADSIAEGQVKLSNNLRFRTQIRGLITEKLFPVAYTQKQMQIFGLFLSSMYSF